MRLYQLENKSISQLKVLKDMTMTHPDLTMEEKEINLKNINELLGSRDIASALVEVSNIELED